MLTRAAFLRRMAFAAMACGFLDVRLREVTPAPAVVYADFDDGDDGAAGRSWDDPVRTLAVAMERVGESGTIHVRPRPMPAGWGLRAADVVALRRP
jgi:hypothetical protein